MKQGDLKDQKSPRSNKMRYQAFFLRLETRVVRNDVPISTAVYDSSLRICNQSEFMDSGSDLAVSNLD